jgi:hypothetical protein
VRPGRADVVTDGIEAAVAGRKRPNAPPGKHPVGMR